MGLFVWRSVSREGDTLNICHRWFVLFCRRETHPVAALTAARVQMRVRSSDSAGGGESIHSQSCGYFDFSGHLVPVTACGTSIQAHRDLKRLIADLNLAIPLET